MKTTAFGAINFNLQLLSYNYLVEVSKSIHPQSNHHRNWKNSVSGPELPKLLWSLRLQSLLAKLDSQQCAKHTPACKACCGQGRKFGFSDAQRWNLMGILTRSTVQQQNIPSTIAAFCMVHTSQPYIAKLHPLDIIHKRFLRTSEQFLVQNSCW